MMIGGHGTVPPGSATVCVTLYKTEQPRSGSFLSPCLAARLACSSRRDGYVFAQYLFIGWFRP